MKNLNILIVDDLFVNRLLLAELVKSLDHSSLQAENGQEAFDILKENEVDLILMDIEMPVLNGLDACKMMRSELPEPKSQTPIIALTAHNPNLFPEDFEDVGFDRLLTKPYSLDKLIDLINDLFK